MLLERLRKFIDSPRRKEGNLDLEISPAASAYLKKLVQRSNPELAEFAFLCLGKNGVIDKILVADKDKLAIGRGLFFEEGFESSVTREELANLSDKLNDSGRKSDLLVLGHLHPSGAKNVKDIPFNVDPSDSLLEPSMGSPEPTSGLDLGFYTEIDKWINADSFPNVGIAANTPEGPKLRIYKTSDLIKIASEADLIDVPQITFWL